MDHGSVSLEFQGVCHGSFVTRGPTGVPSTQPFQRAIHTDGPGMLFPLGKGD